MKLDLFTQYVKWKIVPFPPQFSAQQYMIKANLNFPQNLFGAENKRMNSEIFRCLFTFKLVVLVVSRYDDYSPIELYLFPDVKLALHQIICLLFGSHFYQYLCCCFRKTETYLLPYCIKKCQFYFNLSRFMLSLKIIQTN